MVINEFVKKHLNVGREANFSFWRDSNGNEVDLLIPDADRQFAYEIKSGSTFKRDFFKGLDYWSKLSSADSAHKAVVYTGNSPMKTSGGKVVPWGQI